MVTLAVVRPENAKSSLAETGRLVEDRVEHRGEVTGRGIDDLAERLVTLGFALDGPPQKARYREIAGALFGTARLPERGWKTHDLRDRTVHLARLAFAMMRGRYRRLLLTPSAGASTSRLSPIRGGAPSSGASG